MLVQSPFLLMIQLLYQPSCGEQYLANVRTLCAEIKAGTSASGKVYFTVYKENAVQFDEVNCELCIACLLKMFK